MQCSLGIEPRTVRCLWGAAPSPKRKGDVCVCHMRELRRGPPQAQTQSHRKGFVREIRESPP